ncbi:MAG: MarR family winged helix-turn-helix transcriptional regulator [Nakamurella sp.]
MTTSDWQTAAATLRVAAQLVDGVQAGLVSRGFPDVRPVHGFAFAVLSGGDTTTAGLATSLGVTKQAAAQLVDHLVGCGYLTRRSDPRDGRAQLLVLTERGHACTAAAEQAAAAVIEGWRIQVSAPRFAEFAQALETLAEPGRLRPAW